MFNPFSFKRAAISGDSANRIPLVARIVINLSLCAAPMISCMSSRSNGSPPENRIAGGLGFALLKNVNIPMSSSLLGSYSNWWSEKVEKQMAHFRSHCFVTSITPITVFETWLLHDSQTYGQPSGFFGEFGSSKCLKKSNFSVKLNMAGLCQCVAEKVPCSLHVLVIKILPSFSVNSASIFFWDTGQMVLVFFKASPRLLWIVPRVSAIAGA